MLLLQVFWKLLSIINNIIIIIITINVVVIIIIVVVVVVVGRCSSTGGDLINLETRQFMRLAANTAIFSTEKRRMHLVLDQQ